MHTVQSGVGEHDREDVSSMYFEHSSDIWQEFPELSAGVAFIEGIDDNATLGERTEKFKEIARQRLADQSEAELPEIQAWRRAFSKMSLKPTQYRCASEALLRRFRKEGIIPTVGPPIDLCNAIATAYAIPIAIFDTDRIASSLQVRFATGTETYLAFSGEEEQPEAREVIFADEADRAHARRWTNRQSRFSAVSGETKNALVVAEALHASAASDVANLLAAVVDEFSAIWSVTTTTAILSMSSPRFTF
jgi:DNA/RNA-binding domain of Phe-tRNA-synthetase-like protein